MDYTGIAALLTALAVFLPVIYKLWTDLRTVKEDQATLWHGIIARGYVEAHLQGLLINTGNPARPWAVAEKARRVFDTIKPTLAATRHRLKQELGREPTDDTLAWIFERDLQNWFTDTACPALGVHQHGCLAIACVIARENGDPTVQSYIISPPKPQACAMETLNGNPPPPHKDKEDPHAQSN
jgi:hypothetical protein